MLDHHHSHDHHLITVIVVLIIVPAGLCGSQSTCHRSKAITSGWTLQCGVQKNVSCSGLDTILLSGILPNSNSDGTMSLSRQRTMAVYTSFEDTLTVKARECRFVPPVGTPAMRPRFPFLPDGAFESLPPPFHDPAEQEQWSAQKTEATAKRAGEKREGGSRVAGRILLRDDKGLQDGALPQHHSRGRAKDS
jgi:hypothetical protein